MITAEFSETVMNSRLRIWLLLVRLSYDKRDIIISWEIRHMENDVQRYSSSQIEDTTNILYRGILHEYRQFCQATSITPPLVISPNLKPDVDHVSWNETLTRQQTVIYFAIGDYKTRNYCLLL